MKPQQAAMRNAYDAFPIARNNHPNNKDAVVISKEQGAVSKRCRFSDLIQLLIK